MCSVHSLQCAAAFCRSVKSAIATRDVFVIMVSRHRESGTEELAGGMMATNETSYISVQDVDELPVFYKSGSTEILQY